MYYRKGFFDYFGADVFVVVVDHHWMKTCELTCEKPLNEPVKKHVKQEFSCDFSQVFHSSRKFQNL